MLLPASVEDYVGSENPVRVIDAFVEKLDLKVIGFAERKEGMAGARAYDPRAMIKLFIYGYLNRIRSSRELERACYRNLEVIWLLRMLQPDHWTINAFRKQHAAIFRNVFRHFNLLCGKLDLFGAQLVAIDGTAIKADNSKSRNYTKTKLEATSRGGPVPFDIKLIDTVP